MSDAFRFIAIIWICSMHNAVRCKHTRTLMNVHLVSVVLTQAQPN